MTSPGRTDAELAVAVAAGDREALAAIFDRYGPRLLAFCQSLLRRRADAEDCLQDIFILAATRLGSLREPDRLRPWLFSVARHECLHRLDRSGREVPVDTIPDRPTAPDAGRPAPDMAALDNELGRLLRDAIAGLSDRDRVVLELADQQGLSTDELGAALAMAPGSAYKLLTRARATARNSIGALLVARTGRDNCDELAAILAGWTGMLTPLLRKRVVRHIEGCKICTEQQRRVATPAALLGSVPMVAIPIRLRSNVLDAANASRALSMGVQLRASAGQPGNSAGQSGPTAGQRSYLRSGAGQAWVDGWPPASKSLRSSAAQRHFAPAAITAAAVVVVIVLAGLLFLRHPATEPGQALAATTLSANSASPNTLSPSGTSTGSTTPARSSPGAAGVPGPESSGSSNSSNSFDPIGPGSARVLNPGSAGAPDPVTTGTTSSSGTTPSPGTSSAADRTKITRKTTTRLSTTTPTRPTTTEPATTIATTRSTPSTATTTQPTATRPTTTRPTTTGSTTSTTSTATAATAPQITTMTIVCQISATDGSQAPLLTWATRNTTGIALSIDNPGVVGSYGQYPSSGTLQLPPNGCDPSQPVQEYEIYALGTDGTTAHRTITWTPSKHVANGSTPTTSSTATQTTQTTAQTQG